MYSLTNRSSNTLPFLHMPNAEYARLVGISIPPSRSTLYDTPPRTPASSTRTCSFAGPLSSHPVSPVDFSLPSTPVDAPYRQASPLSMHVLERHQSRRSEHPPPVPTKDKHATQRFYASNAGLGLSSVPTPPSRTDEFLARQTTNINIRHTMIEPDFDHRSMANTAQPEPLVIHSYITPPSSSTSPPTATRPSFASRIFGRSFNRNSSSTITTTKRRSRDSSPPLTSAQMTFPDTPEMSSASSDGSSPHSQTIEIFPSLSHLHPPQRQPESQPTNTKTTSKTNANTKSKAKTTNGYHISNPILISTTTTITTSPTDTSSSNRDSTILRNKSTNEASHLPPAAAPPAAIPRMRRKKSVGNWLDVAKRKSGLWWEGVTAAENNSGNNNNNKENQGFMNGGEGVFDGTTTRRMIVMGGRGGGGHDDEVDVYADADAEKEKGETWISRRTWAQQQEDDDKENRNHRHSGPLGAHTSVRLVVDRDAPKLPELRQMGIRINGGKTGLAEVIGDIGR